MPGEVGPGPCPSTARPAPVTAEVPTEASEALHWLFTFHNVNIFATLTGSSLDNPVSQNQMVWRRLAHGRDRRGKPTSLLPREGEQPKPPDGRGDETSGRPTAQAEASAGNGSRIRVSTREQTLRWRKGRIFSKRRRKNAPRVKSSDPSLAPAVEVSSREGHAGKVQKPLKSR